MTLGKRIIVLAAIALVILVPGVNAYIYNKTRLHIFQAVEMVPTAEVVIIPGAAILKSGKMSPIFKDRADKAIEVYKARHAAKILVSGDSSTVSHNEVNPVRTYLLLQGVPDQDIILDHAGFDTYSTMYRAKNIFGVRSAIISTQSFHLPRSVFLARELRIDAYGVNADNGPSSLKNYVREALASVKAIINLATHRMPKYLGDTIATDTNVNSDEKKESLPVTGIR